MRSISLQRVLPILIAVVLLELGGATLPARGEEVGNPNSVWPEDAIGLEVIRNPLARFQFEGLRLGSSLDDFHGKFPRAKLDVDKVDADAGAKCYVVDKLKAADEARFFFVDGKLYQIEIEYSNPRVMAQGGAEALVRRFVRAFGRPDHAYMNRRTWQQASQARRADLYTSRDGAVLIVSDTGASVRVNEREKRTALEETVELGF